MPASTSTSSSPSVSVISKALKITGQLESTEDIHIEGEVEGDVRGGSVKVGQTARINGTVYGEEVELSGTVNGKIEARKVVLTSTAHMSGDIVHQDLRIDSGAYIDGHCRPEFGRPDGKAHAVQKPAAGTSEARPAFGSTKPAEVRSIA
jgi:cytoskeletal protein CcmA (bactofilin family)